MNEEPNPVHPLNHSCQPQPPKAANSRDFALRGLWREPSTCVLDAHEKNTSRGLEDSRGRWMRNQTQCTLNHSCQPQTPKTANSRDFALRRLWREPSTCVLDAHEKNTSRGLEDSRGRWMMQIPEISLFGGCGGNLLPVCSGRTRKNTSRGLEDSRSRWMRNPVYSLTTAANHNPKKLQIPEI